MGEKVKGHYPCLIEGRFVRPCSSLLRALDSKTSGLGRSKGLFHDFVISLETGENTMSFVKMKLGEFAHKGVIVNFCPFCGINISNHFKEASNAG